MRSTMKQQCWIFLLIIASFAPVLTQLQDEPETVEERIINRQPHRFPARDHKKNYQPSVMPLLPVCSDTVCLLDNSYPTELVSAVMSKHEVLIEQFHSILYRHSAEDLILIENVTDAFRLKGNFACESDVTWGKIGYARDLSGRQQLIINSSRFPQIHRIETCRYADKRCEYLPPCYKSRCQQRFSHVQMIAIDPSRLDPEPYVDLFLVPSACSCFVENFLYF